jgi:predicted nucleotidyltransferase
MGKLTVMLLFLGVSSVAGNASLQQELPAAPEGFSWQKLDEIRGAALLPKGWHFKKEQKKGTLAYFITREDIDKVGEYETGLTIQVFRQPQPNTAEELAGAIIGDYKEKKELLKAWKTSAGIMNGWGYEARIKSPDGAVTMVHGVILSNPNTKTFYLMIFESSEAKWESALKIWEKLQMVAMNDQV